MRCVNYSSR